MLGHRFTAAVDTARRTILALGLATPFVLAMLGPIAPASAAQRDPRDPLERLQVVIKKIHVLDDNDWVFGEGEMYMDAWVGRCTGETAEACRKGAWELNIAHHHRNFDADDGEVVILDRALPGQGFAVSPGERYVFHMEMLEEDRAESIESALDADQMGEISWTFGEDDGWRLGTHSVRAFDEEAFEPGDYEVEFEVRRVPLPDFTARTLRSIDDGGQQFRCVGVENVGLEPSGPFSLTVLVDEIRMRQVELPALGVGQSTEHCVLLSELPPDRQSRLSFVVDDGRQVAEMDEANNRIDLAVDRTRAGSTRPQTGVGPGIVETTAGGSAGPTAPPTPTPNPVLPDLMVSAIRVNGQVPDGKDDCKDGTNTVTVVVKNAGPKKAGDFVVGLVVDDAQGNALEQMVAEGLDPSKEREVKFGGVRLKKGSHSLAATADATTGTGITESDEGNNTLKVTATCKDDG